MPVPEHPQPIWHYYIDADGTLWHEGGELDDPPTLKLFMKNMAEFPEGGAEKWRVFCQGEECRITAEDVPYVVQDLEIHGDGVLLKFPGGYEEKLDPATLQVGARNVLYCRIRGGAFMARFNRKSYLGLAKHIQYDSLKDVFYLIVDNKRYPINGVTS